MPIHPHECRDCGEFEVLTLSMNATIDPTCPGCGKKGERRFGVPLLKTNTSFMRGAKTGGDQFAGGDPKANKVYLDAAKKAGISVQGKIYQHGLAKYPGDPFAWCSSLDEAKAKVKAIGGASPEYGIKAPEQEPKESVVVGEDIIDREIRRRVRKGEMQRKDAVKMREQVADDLAPAYKKGKYKRPQTRKKR